LKTDHLLECESFTMIGFSPAFNYISVYRVNWMRSRAQKNRWEEELPKTEKEMIWTTRYFMHQRDTWYSRLIDLRRDSPRSLGAEAYCEEMIFRWEELGRLADTLYRMANVDFPPIWKPLVTLL